MTRLHVRYDAQSFPEDLVFIETKDRSQFPGPLRPAPSVQGQDDLRRGRRSIRPRCPARFKQEAANLARLTGWKQSEIEMRMEVGGQSVKGAK